MLHQEIQKGNLEFSLLPNRWRIFKQQPSDPHVCCISKSMFECPAAWGVPSGLIACMAERDAWPTESDGIATHQGCCHPDVFLSHIRAYHCRDICEELRGEWFLDEMMSVVLCIKFAGDRIQVNSKCASNRDTMGAHPSACKGPSANSPAKGDKQSQFRDLIGLLQEN